MLVRFFFIDVGWFVMVEMVVIFFFYIVLNIFVDRIGLVGRLNIYRLCK